MENKNSNIFLNQGYVVEHVMSTTGARRPDLTCILLL